MFIKYICGLKNNKKDNPIIEISRNTNTELDTSHHFGELKDGINNKMDIIKQKIEHYVALNFKELEYIKELDREELYNIVWLFNKNNAKY